MDELRKAIEAEAGFVLGDIAGEVLKTAQQESFGPFSLAALARADHPYARRNAGKNTGLYPPGRINRQTGAFLADWKVEKTDAGYAVVNANPVADFLEKGTKYMVARPIKERVETQFTDKDWKF